MISVPSVSRRQNSCGTENMSRLVTFGCSFVYGHGLPDCFTEPSHYGPNPSKFAWPQLLADKLGYECVNLARPASGNFRIFMSILNTEFQPGDLVITAWSFFTRFDIYALTDLAGNGKQLPVKENLENSILADLYRVHEHYDIKNFWDNWLTIHHSELFLNSKNVKNFSYMGDRFQVDPQPPKQLQLNNFLEDLHLIEKDKALDKEHPGLVSHMLQAEIIYNRIKNKI